MNSDKLTTLLGVTAAVSQGLHQFGLAPQYTGIAGVVSVALLGYFSNKPVKF